MAVVIDADSIVFDWDAFIVNSLKRFLDLSQDSAQTLWVEACYAPSTHGDLLQATTSWLEHVPVNHSVDQSFITKSVKDLIEGYVEVVKPRMNMSQLARIYESDSANFQNSFTFVTRYPVEARRVLASWGKSFEPRGESVTQTNHETVAATLAHDLLRILSAKLMSFDRYLQQVQLHDSPTIVTLKPSAYLQCIPGAKFETLNFLLPSENVGPVSDVPPFPELPKVDSVHPILPQTVERLLWNGSCPIPKISLRGKVVHGFGRGSKLMGIPTANVECDISFAPTRDAGRPPAIADGSKITFPFPGVYAGSAAVLSDAETQTWYPAAVNVGYCPSFGNKDASFEVHLIAEGLKDFYGADMTVDLTHVLRTEAAPNGFSELIRMIQYDCEVAAELGHKNL